MFEIDTIYQGHAIDIMRQMPDKWLNYCITSPPYWGLRDYKIEPLIWDGDPECEHDWEVITHQAKGGHAKLDNMPNVGANRSEIENGISVRFGYESQFCLKCNAWRGSLGLEPTMDMFINHLCSIFDVVKQNLRDDGTLWVNLGDTYASNGSQDTRFWHGDNPGKHKFNGDGELSKGYSGRCRTNEVPSKSLCMIPFRFAIEMVNRGWILRNDIIWHKPNCMPSSAKDRFTVDFEHVFFFTKSKRYYFEQQFEQYKTAAPENISYRKNGKSDSRKINNGGTFTMATNGFWQPEGSGRNKRAVWSINTRSFSEAHFATFPETLIEPMIKAGCPEFVCVKCGKPREKILDRVDKRHWIERNDYKEGKYSFEYLKTKQRNEVGRNDAAAAFKIPEYYFLGYTDCGCNAGFDGGIVYDPFMGAGTVAVVARRLNRHYVGSELNPKYIDMANRRIANEIPQMEFSLAGG